MFRASLSFGGQAATPLSPHAAQGSGQPSSGQTVALGFTSRRFPMVIKGSGDFPDWLKRARSLNGPASLLPLYGIQAFGYQIHSNRIQLVTKKEISTARGALLGFEDTDGLATAECRVQLSIFSADCLPVFIIVPGKRPWIALVHAGWKGTLLKITPSAVRRIRAWSGVHPRSYRIILGPCLRSCCYEVGSEFESTFPRTTRRRRNVPRLKMLARDKTPRLHFDLARENRIQLLKEGVTDSRITDSGFCTFCRNDLFYSYRREKEKAGRTLSWIFINGPGPVYRRGHS